MLYQAKEYSEVRSSQNHIQNNNNIDDDMKFNTSVSIVFTLLAALAIAISYADRSNLSTAIIPMADQFHWDGFFSGLVLSSFWLGYASTQILGGKIADVIGGESLIVVALLMWSLCTALTPIAANHDNVSLIIDRVLLGAGEGLAFPAIHSMIPSYIPPEQRATSASIVTAACFIGAMVSNLVTPALISSYSWDASFYSFALLPPLIWLPLWTYFINHRTRRDVSSSSNSDDDNPSSAVDTSVNGAVSSADQFSVVMETSPTSINIINNNIGFSDGDMDDLTLHASVSSTTSSTYKASVLELLQQKPVWAIIAAQYGQSWGLYGLLSWLPTYYSDRFHVPLVELGAFTALPYLIQSVVSISAGFMADALVVKYKWRVLNVRNLFQTVGMLTPAICLTYCAYGPLIEATVRSYLGASSSSSSSSMSLEPIASSVLPAVAATVIAVGSAAGALTSAAVSCNQFDISPQNSGTIFGIANTASCVAALIAVPISGVLFDATHSWDAVFLLFAVHYVVGNILWLRWASDQPLVFGNSAANADKKNALQKNALQ